MSFPQQLGYPQFLGAPQEAFGGDRAGVRGGGSEGAANPPAAAAVTPVLGMYPNPWSAGNYSAFLPYNSAELALLTHMGTQYELKDPPGAHSSGFVPAPPGFYPYGQYQYGDPSRAKSATRETTSTLKAWLQEHKKNPYPTKGEKIMLAIITKMTLTQVSTWFANARRRLKKENKVTWGRSAEDRDGRIFDSDNEEEGDKNEDDEEIDLESVDEAGGDQGKPRGKATPGDHADDENLEPKRTFSLQGDDDKEPQVVKGGGAASPDGSSAKPKIWSLAETATSPDSTQKAPHPAFLPTHGIYTCQIGKLQTWASAAFLGVSNVRSLLEAHHGGPLERRSPAGHSGHSGPDGDSDSSSGGCSPPRHDHEDAQRAESRTSVLRSPFPSVHDRSHHETTQRVLKSIS
ncbi:iroquois-class homeodomain protein IRX-1b isoform X2 [Denticeps clupeoides]|uniref:Homeobox domain-containing protein n=1 Tax=Denticeps clupeoides TaxID=299321 RepID=A0AAY4E0N9_9TELE|nr:iroquois-class homeodomain protein IRX-1 isoform X2 [Denticeps clupeoides]